jgi:hypothetical protein
VAISAFLKGRVKGFEQNFGFPEKFRKYFGKTALFRKYFGLFFWGEHDCFIAPHQRGGGPGRGMGRLAALPRCSLTY